MLVPGKERLLTGTNGVMNNIFHFYFYYNFKNFASVDIVNKRRNTSFEHRVPKPKELGAA